MQKLRKVISISVMALTVFVMSGLGSLASAASAQPGDLVKAAGNKTVYYLGSDSRLYNIPNEDTYFSWYKDWSGVITISVTDLNSYGNGIPAGFVTMRPGTRLIQRDVTTDNTVYAVETNGILRPITTANAIALYGSTWASKVTKVSDQNFLSYTVSTSLPTGQYPIGTLLKTTAGADVFYFDGTNYRRIANEAAFNANRFNARFIVKTSMNISASGSEITGMESGLINAAQNGGTIVTPPVVTGSGLTLSLNSNTPVAASVPGNGARVSMAKVNLTASNDGAITVNSITVKRIGLSTHDNIDKVWAENNGTIVASKKSMNSNDESILTFSPALTVPAGQTITLEFIASLKPNSSSDIAGNIGLSIASASAVSATAANTVGAFPINGNLMSATNYNVADVTVDLVSTSSVPVKVGDKAVDLGKFRLNTVKDVVLTSIMLKNNGNEDLSTATANLYLEQGGNKISSNTVVNGRFVTFTFNNGTEIKKDDANKTFYIKGDIVSKENSNTPSLNLFLNKSTDLAGYEKATGFGFNVIDSATPSAAADNFEISKRAIDAGAILITKKSKSPSATTVVKGSDNTILFANVRADEAINADGLRVHYSTTTATQFENVRVYLNGALLDSFDPETVNGYKDIDSSINLNKGDNEIKIAVKAKANATNGSINFEIKSTVLGVQNPEYVISGNKVQPSEITGSAKSADFTVASADLDLVRNDGYADTKIVRGSTDVSLGKFIAKAVNDKVKITSIVLTPDSSNTIAPSSVSNIKLFIDGVDSGKVVNWGTSGATISSLNIEIAKDSTKNIEIKGSFDSSAIKDQIFVTKISVNAQDSNGSDLNITDNPVSAKFTMAEEGSLNVTLGADTKVSSIILAKSGVEQEIAQYRLTAVDDSATITELTMTTASTTDPRISEFRLYDGANLISTANPMVGTTTFKISDNKLVVAANSNKIVTIKAVLNPITTNNQTGGVLQTTLTGYKFNSSANAEISTTTLTIPANAMNIRKTMPTFALVSGVTGGQGSMQSVLTFTVAADANEDVVLKKLVFTESGSASGTSAVSNYYLYEGDVEKVGSTASTTLSMDITVAKGTAKTFTVKADTSAVPVDATFGLSLEKGTSGANIGWEEYFVGGNSPATGEYLSGFPISGSTMKY